MQDKDAVNKINEIEEFLFDDGIDGLVEISKSGTQADQVRAMELLWQMYTFFLRASAMTAQANHSNLVAIKDGQVVKV